MSLSFFKLTSINSRIILGTITIVSFFMILIGITLSKTFYHSAYSALEDRLTGQVYLLMADRDIIPSAHNPKQLVEALDSSEPSSTLQLSGSKVSINNTYSQLSGYITSSDGTILWQSDTNSRNILPPKLSLSDGEMEHGKKVFQHFFVDKKPYIALSIAIFWDFDNPRFPLIYHISDDLTHLNNKISDYQYSLWINLFFMSLVLFISLFLILRWSLKPLRVVEQEIKAVEQGKQELLEKSYPDEITPLTHNINRLIQFERQQQLRYRNALADLAHSLKTPLAIIKGQNSITENPQESHSNQTSLNYKTINDAVDRMNSIIEYQLQRAGSNNPSPHIQYLNLSPIVHMLLESMKKIYRDKNIHFDLQMDSSLQFKIDEGDFMEILGNLLDNACKWCDKEISLRLTQHNEQFEIFVSDDGPGIASDMISEITKRGVRADEFTPGHGVGLAIVQDITSTYNGTIQFLKSKSDGLEIRIVFTV